MHYATAEEMEKLDERAIARGLEVRQMMELAGWHAVELFHTLEFPRHANTVVICGTGNKAGDGLSAARHLANHGYVPTVILLTRIPSADAVHHLALIEKMHVPILEYKKQPEEVAQAIKNADVLVDALIGYHLAGAPRGAFAEIIPRMNDSGAPIVAYDLPTGLDATSGECLEPCIRARATLSLALPKRAFLAEGCDELCGEIFLADIGIPRFIYNEVTGAGRPNFDSGVVRIVR